MEAVEEEAAPLVDESVDQGEVGNAEGADEEAELVPDVEEADLLFEE
ncbi:MAG: hypothetical protein ACYS9X_05560 [Planctomycetota bacterium]